jgi:hypothetical protein
VQTEQQIPGARRTVVGFYDDAFEAAGEAWVTEQRWNGWLIPHFERDDLITALPHLASSSTALAMDGDVLVIWQDDECICGEDGGGAASPNACLSGAKGCEAFTRIEANPVYGTYDLSALGYTFEENIEAPALYDWDAVMEAEPASCPDCGSIEIHRRMVAPLGAEPMGTVSCPDCRQTVWSMVAPRVAKH